MAITASAVINQPSYKSWTVTCLDADTTGNIAHGFGATPDAVILTQVFFEGNTNPNWAAAVGGTNITLLKANTASSGGTTPGTTVVLKVVAMLPHTVMQG
jgi:hypothetical protein